MADRDVRVNLKLEATGAAPKALKDCAAAADTASKHTSQFERDLKRLDGGRAASVGKAYADVAREAERATQSAKALNAETAKMRGGATGINGPGGQAPKAKFEQAGGSSQPPGLAQQFGVDPGALAAAGQVLAATQAVAKALSATAKGIEAFNDDTLTTNQALRKFAEGLPVFGEVYKGLGELTDAISGKAQVIKKLARDDAKSTAKSQAELAASQASTPFQQQVSAIDARSKAMKDYPALGFNPPSRDTFQGDLDYSRYERKQPLLEDERRAKIEAATAASVESKAAADSRALADQLAAKTAEKDRALKEFGAIPQAAPQPGRPPQSLSQASAGDWTQGILKATVGLGSGPTNFWKGASSLNPLTVGTAESSFESTDKLKKGAEVKGLLQEEIKLRAQLSTAQQQEAGAIKANADAQSKARQAGIALLKDELQYLKEKEQSIRGQATSFGGLDASQRFSASQAANQFKERGFESLTADQKAILAQAGGGQALAFAQQKSAQNDPSFKQFFADLGMDSDLAGVQKKQVELSANIGLEVALDEEKFAQQIEKALKPALAAIVKTFKDIAAATVTQVDLNQDLINAQ